MKKLLFGELGRLVVKDMPIWDASQTIPPLQLVEQNDITDNLAQTQRNSSICNNRENRRHQVKSTRKNMDNQVINEMKSVRDPSN